MAVARTGRTSLRESLGELLVGTDADGVVGEGTLLVDAGTVLTLDAADESVTPYFGIGRDLGSHGTATITGLGSQVVLKTSGLASDKTLVALGYEGHGSLTVSDEALLRIEGPAEGSAVTSLVVAGRQGGSGDLALDHGRLEIAAFAARFTVGGSDTIGAGTTTEDTTGGIGSARLENGSSLEIRGVLTNNSGQFGIPHSYAYIAIGDAGGTGSLAVAGSTIRVRQVEFAFLDIGLKRLGFEGDGTVSVTKGGVVDLQATELASLDLGDGGSGELIVDGIGSALLIKSNGNASFDLGNSDGGGTGKAVVRNGGSLLVQGKYAEGLIGGRHGSKRRAPDPFRRNCTDFPDRAFLRRLLQF
jgi:T5SS/PEP-CTERM-associated repeat protein